MFLFMHICGSLGISCLLNIYIHLFATWLIAMLYLHTACAPTAYTYVSGRKHGRSLSLRQHLVVFASVICLLW